MDSSASSQRSTILRYLNEHGSLTTLQCREELGIMHPAARIRELRESGHNIVTHWAKSEDRTGTMHREAKYVSFFQP